jgi:hypothetical protein
MCLIEAWEAKRVDHNREDELLLESISEGDWDIEGVIQERTPWFLVVLEIEDETEMDWKGREPIIQTARDPGGEETWEQSEFSGSERLYVIFILRLLEDRT